MRSPGAYVKLLSSIFSSKLDPLFLPRTSSTTLETIIKMRNSPIYVPPWYTDEAFRESVVVANIIANCFPYIEPSLKNLYTSILTVVFYFDDINVFLTVLRDQCFVKGDYLNFNDDLREMKKYLSPVKHIYVINDSLNTVYSAILEPHIRLLWKDQTIKMILRENSILWKGFSVMMTSNLEDNVFHQLMTIEPAMTQYVIDSHELISLGKELREEGIPNILYWNLPKEEQELMQSDDPSTVLRKEVDRIYEKCEKIISAVDGWDDSNYSVLKRRVFRFMQDIIASQLSASRYE